MLVAWFSPPMWGAFLFGVWIVSCTKLNAMFDSLSTDDLAVLLIATIAFFVVGAMIVRAIFSIPKILRYQKALIKLQALTAEQLKADDDIIREIVFEADPEFKNDPHFAIEPTAEKVS